MLGSSYLSPPILVRLSSVRTHAVRAARRVFQISVAPALGRLGLGFRDGTN
jgi:hypothetical protein